VADVVFSPDGRRVFTASGDRTIKVWDTASGQEILTLRGNGGGIVGLALSPDGHRLASTDIDGPLRIWDATPLP
jgi:WD40 repeat protein